MTTAIFDPGEHEPLANESWDEGLARAFVRRIVLEADDAYSDERGGWPAHPEDDESARKTFRGLYFGAAGTMWAITHLAHTNGVTLKHNYGTAVARCEDSYRMNPIDTETVVPSYFLGTVGIMTAAYAITGDRALLDRIAGDMRVNTGNPAREALWGSSGTALAALLLSERDGDHRYDDVLRAVQEELWATWEPARKDGGLLWEQDLYGFRRRFVGAAHGALGNLAPFVRASHLLSSARKAELLERVPALLEIYAIRDGNAANWPALGEPCEGNRMQWCHGSPGVIMALASYPVQDDRVERLLVAGGEGIWKAGPVRKGPTLCHGTAGNGFALLRLAVRTSDPRWERRAECFAMHAIRQVADWRQKFGVPSFSLWTGELGVALYVDAVLRKDADLVTLDVM
jgi:hypothetical protein